MTTSIYIGSKGGYLATFKINKKTGIITYSCTGDIDNALKISAKKAIIIIDNLESKDKATAEVDNN